MLYVYANVTLTPGQIKKLQSKHAASTGVSITLKSSQLALGPNKLSLTKTQINHLSRAKSASKGTRIDFAAAASKDIPKTGEIFPLLAAIPGLISAAAPAVEKAAALGAVGIEAGMALEKTTGKGIVYKEGLRKIQTPKTLSGSIRSGPKTSRNSSLVVFKTLTPLSNFDLLDAVKK